jgi:hypothetical protein
MPPKQAISTAQQQQTDFPHKTINKENKTKMGTYSRKSILQKTQAHNGCYRRDHNWADESATQRRSKSKSKRKSRLE